MTLYLQDSLNKQALDCFLTHPNKSFYDLILVFHKLNSSIIFNDYITKTYRRLSSIKISESHQYLVQKVAPQWLSQS